MTALCGVKVDTGEPLRVADEVDRTSERTCTDFRRVLQRQQDSP